MPPQILKSVLDDNLWPGLKVQVRCIHALMIRDLMMRYGRGNIGFLWVVLEAMMLTIGVMIIWSAIRPPMEQGVQVVLLAFTGYMLLTMWRHSTNTGTCFFEQNVALLYHRHISLLDIFISRVLLEFAGMTTSLFFLATILVDSGLIDPPRDLGLIVVAWLSMFWLSSGLALNLAVLTQYYKTSERFIAPVQYFYLPLSGAFYMVNWLPKFARDIVWYAPTTHCYEMFRAGFLSEGVLTYYTVWYPLLWALGLTFLGLWGMDKVRNDMHLG